jgi:hypothetical protein
MAAMAHRSPSLGSAVYLWRDGGFHLYQKISTHGALSWRHFTMGKKVQEDILEMLKYTLKYNCTCSFVDLTCCRYSWWCPTPGRAQGRRRQWRKMNCQ